MQTQAFNSELELSIHNFEQFTTRNSSSWTINLHSLMVAKVEIGKIAPFSRDGVFAVHNWLGRKVVLVCHFLASFFTDRFRQLNQQKANNAFKEILSSLNFIQTSYFASTNLINQANGNGAEKASALKLLKTLMVFVQIFDAKCPTTSIEKWKHTLSHSFYSRTGWIPAEFKNAVVLSDYHQLKATRKFADEILDTLIFGKANYLELEKALGLNLKKLSEMYKEASKEKTLNEQLDHLATILKGQGVMYFDDSKGEKYRIYCENNKLVIQKQSSYINSIRLPSNALVDSLNVNLHEMGNDKSVKSDGELFCEIPANKKGLIISAYQASFTWFKPTE